MNVKHLLLIPLMLALAASSASPNAQPGSTPDVSASGYITFTLIAPRASRVYVSGNDIPQLGVPVPMQKSSSGVWELKVGPVKPGAYRYSFVVDGAKVLDYRNTRTSESNDNNWSLVHVPGSSYLDEQAVPQGQVMEVRYFSTILGRVRRMHVYTPPGYMLDDQYFPVLYLLHGALDSDDSWSTVGRAGVILDNLIATGRAEPMIVVMPDGHSEPYRFSNYEVPLDEFEREFSRDIVPWIGDHYRVLGGSENKAIAGLSMGGAQALEAAFSGSQQFGYVGIFSSGILDIRDSDEWELVHAPVLDDGLTRQALKLLWFATGENDFLLGTSRATVSMFESHGFGVSFTETGGGHTWINWREYLNAFVPRLFDEDRGMTRYLSDRADVSTD